MQFVSPFYNGVGDKEYPIERESIPMKLREKNRENRRGLELIRRI
jgi:hypothetical protein